MDRFDPLWQQHALWLRPVLFVLAGLVLGVIVERIILNRLRKFAGKTRSGADDVVVRALGNQPVFWAVLAGLYAATKTLPIPGHYLILLHQALIVIFLLSLTIVAARAASGLVGYSAAQSEGLLPTTSILTNLTSVIVFALGFLVILQTLGISVTPVLGALGVGGLAVALALQDTLSNLFAGLHIIASRQVRLGDYVRLDSGEEGYVTDIQWRNTSIRALANNMIIVPNSKLASAIVTNLHLPDTEMGFVIQIGVAYGTDLDRAELVALEVANDVMQTVTGGVPSSEPSVRFHTFGDSAIQGSVAIRCREFVDQFLVRHEFVKRLHRRFAQEGIEIPFPVRTVYVRSTEGEAPMPTSAGK
jgi:small-conductance mechanosensitive channel